MTRIICAKTNRIWYFARECHVQENAEDVKGQEGNDDFGDDARHDFLEFLEDVLHGAAAFMGNAQSSYE